MNFPTRLWTITSSADLEHSLSGSFRNLSSWIVPAREAQLLQERSRRELNALLPASPDAISYHPNLSAKELLVRFRGLVCLRWHESGIYFGARDVKTKWNPGKAKELQQLFRELEKYRHPLASETRHPLFRAQAERWLEFLVRQNVTRVDSTLDPQFTYAQVLASTAGEHGILHVLSVTRAGRLAILELKTVEHPVFLLQAKNTGCVLAVIWSRKIFRVTVISQP